MTCWSSWTLSCERECVCTSLLIEDSLSYLTSLRSTTLGVNHMLVALTHLWDSGGVDLSLDTPLYGVWQGH